MRQPPTTLETFDAHATRVGATVHRVRGGTESAVAVRIAREAGARTVGLARVLSRRASFVEAFAAAGIREVPTDVLWPTRRADVGVSVARLGVAETGSLLVHSTSEDRRVELCVDVHIVVLAADAIVPTLDEAFAGLRDIAARPPACAALLSGPSRSADIERQITVGVHGPRELHIVVLEPAS